MSVRAYKIEKIERTGEKLNLWHDSLAAELLGFFQVDNGLDGSGCGIIELNKEEVKQAIKDLEEDWDGYLKMDKYNKEDLKKTKAKMEEILDEFCSNNYIMFQCF